ncbi:MAG: N-acetylmuramoyl-L-alanine amidase family protein, partial [Chitinophagaceae bacterium]
NNLDIRIKRPPKSLHLKNLTIGIDPGHGGTNYGAQGPTGVWEKQLSLAISLKLRTDLQNAGAKVIMTRTTDTTFNNGDRILFFRKIDPDLLVSIHLNSSSDPVHTMGTSTYYRYVGFRPLSLDIYRRMVGLGLAEKGNVGSFNFMLNGPTEYPNALVETLFLSNPQEEMKALDPLFQEKMARAIVQGIRDFLHQSSSRTNSGLGQPMTGGGPGPG